MSSIGAERGAAPVEFAMVLVILLPLFTAIFQFGLFLHLRNTLVACAHEGARQAANFQGTLAQGEDLAGECAGDTMNASLIGGVRGEDAGDVVEMEISWRMPALGMWFPAFDVSSTGHAVQEPDPTQG